MRRSRPLKLLLALTVAAPTFAFATAGAEGSMLNVTNTVPVEPGGKVTFSMIDGCDSPMPATFGGAETHAAVDAPEEGENGISGTVEVPTLVEGKPLNPGIYEVRLSCGAEPGQEPRADVIVAAPHEAPSSVEAEVGVEPATTTAGSSVVVTAAAGSFPAEEPLTVVLYPGAITLDTAPFTAEDGSLDAEVPVPDDLPPGDLQMFLFAITRYVGEEPTSVIAPVRRASLLIDENPGEDNGDNPGEDPDPNPDPGQGWDPGDIPVEVPGPDPDENPDDEPGEEPSEEELRERDVQTLLERLQSGLPLDGLELPGGISFEGDLEDLLEQILEEVQRLASGQPPRDGSHPELDRTVDVVVDQREQEMRKRREQLERERAQKQEAERQRREQLDDQNRELLNRIEERQRQLQQENQVAQREASEKAIERLLEGLTDEERQRFEDRKRQRQAQGEHERRLAELRKQQQQSDGGTSPTPTPTPTPAGTQPTTFGPVLRSVLDTLQPQGGGWETFDPTAIHDGPFTQPVLMPSGGQLVGNVVDQLGRRGLALPSVPLPIRLPGFSSGQHVHVAVASRVTSLGVETAGTDGVVTAALQLPADLAPGDHTLYGIGEDRAVVAPLEVASADDVVAAVLAAVQFVETDEPVVPVTPVEPDPAEDSATPLVTGQLPRTGTSPVAQAIAGLVALTLGSVLVRSSRRPRSTQG